MIIKTRVITADTPERFEERINEAAKEVSPYKINTHYSTVAHKGSYVEIFTAVLFYKRLAK